MAWGRHLILDMAGCDVEIARDANRIAEFCEELCTHIDMERHGEPLLTHFGEGELAGWTCVQLIVTSNITMHFMDHNGDCYLDLFTCGPLNEKRTQAFVIQKLKPETIHAQLVEREARR